VEIQDTIKNLKNEADKEIGAAMDQKSLEEIRIKYLGKKGILTQILHSIGEMPQDKRPQAGLLANAIKGEIALLYRKKLEELIPGTVGICTLTDLTLPGRKMTAGRFHPLSLISDEILQIFKRLGFNVVDGREIETEYYNFEALNTPEDHPARDLQDTFYITRDILLRTHTSPVQIRVMENSKPPIRIVSSGKCYRRDASDATHSPTFHQIEGLMVDKGVTFAHLKGILSSFLVQLFGVNTVVRFTPSYFPFTEPSVEVSIGCWICKRKGCHICGNGYLEILGAGMVDPNVFKYVKYDSKKYSGFAFGMGIERTAMLKYGIEDIRLFLENDIRFLKQF